MRRHRQRGVYQQSLSYGKYTLKEVAGLSAQAIRPTHHNAPADVQETTEL